MFFFLSGSGVFITPPPLSGPTTKKYFSKVCIPSPAASRPATKKNPIGSFQCAPRPTTIKHKASFAILFFADVSTPPKSKL